MCFLYVLPFLLYASSICFLLREIRGLCKRNEKKREREGERKREERGRERGERKRE
jgi:hypothetical protein